VRRKLTLALLTVFLAMGLSVARILLISLYTTINRGDCAVHPPLARPLYDTQAVFVAKIVYVSLAWNPSKNYEPWTIGLVQHRYWGLPWWTSKGSSCSVIAPHTSGNVPNTLSVLLVQPGFAQAGQPRRPSRVAHDNIRQCGTRGQE
jgi:hypothetical protein